jgi:hypothetical protein
VEKSINVHQKLLINSPGSPLLSGHGAPHFGQIIDRAGDACVEHGDGQKWQHKGQHRVYVVEIDGQVFERFFHGARFLKQMTYILLTMCSFHSHFILEQELL